jgi:hypothetical protein
LARRLGRLECPKSKRLARETNNRRRPTADVVSTRAHRYPGSGVSRRRDLNVLPARRPPHSIDAGTWKDGGSLRAHFITCIASGSAMACACSGMAALRERGVRRASAARPSNRFGGHKGLIDVGDAGARSQRQLGPPIYAQTVRAAVRMACMAAAVVGAFSMATAPSRQSPTSAARTSWTVGETVKKRCIRRPC